MYLLKYMLVTALFMVKSFLANFCAFFLYSLEKSDILKSRSYVRRTKIW